MRPSNDPTGYEQLNTPLTVRVLQTLLDCIKRQTYVQSVSLKDAFQVRDLSKAASLGMDPSDYQNAMQGLETEVIKMKDVYNQEVNSLRFVI